MPARLPRPCAAVDAIARAQELLELAELGNTTHPYWLGTGDFVVEGRGPWTTNNGGTGCDCHGLICYAFKTRRHRPGHNAGPWSTVVDWQNCDSAIEDAEHEQDLWIPVPESDVPRPGDIAAWPSIYVVGKRVRIGHVMIIESTARLVEWDWSAPSWELLDGIHVCGPNGRRPAAVRTTGAMWAGRERPPGLAADPRYRSRILRSVDERAAPTVCASGPAR